MLYNLKINVHLLMLIMPVYLCYCYLIMVTTESIFSIDVTNFYKIEKILITLIEIYDSITHKNRLIYQFAALGLQIPYEFSKNDLIYVLFIFIQMFTYFRVLFSSWKRLWDTNRGDASEHKYV